MKPILLKWKIRQRNKEIHFSEQIIAYFVFNDSEYAIIKKFKRKFGGT